MPVQAMYLNYGADLGKIIPFNKQCSSKFHYTFCRWLTSCNLSATYALLVSSHENASHFIWLISRREIGSRVGRNQTTVMRICDRWRQEGTTDRRGRSHPPQCTTSLSARTIRRRLQQSGLSTRRPLLGLPLTQNHRRLHRQWCEERRIWAAEWNEVVFTDESRICLQHHYGRIRVWRHRGERMLNSCIMHRHTGPAPGVMVLEPVVLPYLQGLATAILQQDNARPHVARIVQRFFVNYQIELLPWPARSPDLSPIENMWSMVAQRLTQITSPAATPDQLWQRVEAAFVLLYPKNTSKVSLNQCRGLWQR
ncbi:transposable element Tcb1 transposase [Trichonephila clavipes]|nr:transposable element Tcb1 transposase [Trichonephila clavipes]